MTPSRKMLRITASCAVLMLLGLSSCAQMLPRNSRKEATERWSEVRAKLKYQLALETFNHGQLEEARKQLDEALALNPASADAHILRARILLERGETAAASAALDEGMKYGADNAETDYLSGMISQRYGRFADALAWYERAAEREPMNAHYVVAVAEALVAVDRPAEALQVVQRRLTDFEQNATLRALAGEIYMMLDRYEEAAASYRDAVRIASDDKRLRSQLGLALTLAGEYREAEAVLSSVLEGEEGASAEAHHEPSVLAALGRCRLALNQPEKARAALRGAVEADPGNAAHWTLLARAALSCDDLLTARKAAAEAVRLQPTGERELLLAYVCWAQRDYSAAIEAAERAMRENPADTMSLYLIARSRQARGEVAAARLYCQQALSQDPECSWARQLLEARPAAPAAGRDRYAPPQRPFPARSFSRP